MDISLKIVQYSDCISKNHYLSSSLWIIIYPIFIHFIKNSRSFQGQILMPIKNSNPKLYRNKNIHGSSSPWCIRIRCVHVCSETGLFNLTFDWGGGRGWFYPLFLRTVFTANTRHFQGCLGDIKSVDTPVNYFFFWVYKQKDGG